MAAKRKKRTAPRPRRLNTHSFRFEPLEDRRMLATVTWDGGGDGVTWNDAANWDVGGADQLPIAGDDVTIDVPGSDPVVLLDVSVSLSSLTTNEDLFIDGGSLTVSGAANVNADLTMLHGTLIADGATASVSATNASSLDDANIRALNGATIALPATSYSEGNATLEAVGAGSLLDLSSVATLQGGGFIRQVNINATDGGKVDLSGLTQITGGATLLTATGTNSLIDMTSLTDFNDTNGNRISLLRAANNGKIDVPLLTTLDAVYLELLDASATIPTAQIESMTGGKASIVGQAVDFSSLTTATSNWFTLSGGATANLNNLSNADSATFRVNDGVTLSLPAITTYTEGSSTLLADGVGSQLVFPSLTTLQGGGFVRSVFVEAKNGGLVDLSQVTAITGGSTRIIAEHTGSKIDLAALTSFDDTNGNRVSELTALDSGEINVPMLTTTSAVNINLDSTGSIQTSQITSMTGASASLTGRAVDFSSLTTATNNSFTLSSGATANLNNLVNADAASFRVHDGVTLNLPAITTYTEGSSTLLADGVGSQLVFPSLTTLEGGGFVRTVFVEAKNGGLVDLSALATITGGSTRFVAEHVGSKIDLAALASFNDTNGNRVSELTAINNGEINVPLLTTTSAVNFNLDNTGIMPTSQIASMTDGNTVVDNRAVDFSGITPATAQQFTLVNGGTANLDNLASADAAGFIVNDGVTLSLPALTSYTEGNSLLRANGTNSRLEFPALASIVGGSFVRTVFIEADNGGHIDLSSVSAITGGATDISVDGGTIDLTQLTQWDDTNGNRTSRLRADNGGVVSLTPTNLSVNAVVVTLTDTGTLDGGTLTIGTSSVLDGSGQLDANLINNGKVRPGSSPGSHIILGDFTQSSSGTLEVEIAGTTQSTEYDWLNVAGHALLDGTLSITRPGGFLPAELDTFEIIKHNSSSGTFATINGDALSNLLVHNPIYSTASVNLRTVPEVFINDISVAEGDSGTATATFTVTLSTIVGHDVTFDFSTADDFAKLQDADYLASQGTATVLAGDLTTTISIDAVGDVGLERDESLLVNLTSPIDGRLTDPQGVATILNDDVLPAIEIADIITTEPASGTRQVEFVVELSAPAPDQVSVDFATSDGTAAAPLDYAVTSGSLTFDAAPSDGLVSDGSEGAFAPTSHVTVPLPADGILNYTTIDIPAGVTVTFTKNANNTSAILLATGHVNIQGSINVSASGRIGGVGGGDGGLKGTGDTAPAGNGTDGEGLSPGTAGLATDGFVGSGGGGGGYGTAGLGPTTRSTTQPGIGGAAIDISTDIATRGGSGGGGGAGWEKFGNLNGGDGGGAGGGIIVVSSHGTITVDGSIRANGANGQTSFANAFGWGGEGGGGSGGLIDLQADDIVINGTLESNGGLGGGIGTIPSNNANFSSGAHGGDGYIRLTGDVTNNGTLAGVTIINPLDVRRTISVTVNSDSVAEHNEDFLTTLSAAVNGIITNATATATIQPPLDIAFVADRSDGQTELFRSSGGPENTAILRNIGGSQSSSPHELTLVGETLFFAATGADGEVELFKVNANGSAQRVKDLAGAISSQPHELTSFDDKLFFAATGPDGNTELYVSDGTNTGTTRVKNLSGTTSSNPHELTVVDNRLFFTAKDTVSNIELYASDGTSAGTNRVRNLGGNAISSDPKELTALGSSLLFTALTASNERELHKSDGSHAGTSLLTDLSGTVSANPQQLTVVDNRLYFVASTSTGERELFVSDGTAGGTVQVADLNGSASSDPAELTQWDGKLYFVATHAGQRELHVATGTSASLFKNLHGATDSHPHELTAGLDRLFFAATGIDGETELYASDGTGPGTSRIRNLSGNISSNPHELAAVGSGVYFAATSSTNDIELFHSDGTSAGTSLVKNLAGSPTPNQIIPFSLSEPVNVSRPNHNTRVGLAEHKEDTTQRSQRAATNVDLIFRME